MAQRRKQTAYARRLERLRAAGWRSEREYRKARAELSKRELEAIKKAAPRGEIYRVVRHRAKKDVLTGPEARAFAERLRSAGFSDKQISKAFKVAGSPKRKKAGRGR